MTRALVTGGTGFAGRFLVQHLADDGVEVHATAHSADTEAPGAEAIHALDVRDADAVSALVRELQPDEIYHLAGVTRPASGDVAGFYDVNLGGARNVLDALTDVAPDAKLLLVGSAYAYAPNTEPIVEAWPLEPHNHYGASKAAAEMLGRAYAADGLHVVLARPFNHSGPGQSPDFVLPTIVQQFDAARSRGDDVVTLQLGNLASIRDISDARDVVRAYSVMLRSGTAGGAYNAGAGQGHTIRELVDIVSKSFGIAASVDVDADRLRTGDVSTLVANVDRLVALGWNAERSLVDTVDDMANRLDRRATA